MQLAKRIFAQRAAFLRPQVRNFATGKDNTPAAKEDADTLLDSLRFEKLNADLLKALQEEQKAKRDGLSPQFLTDMQQAILKVASKYPAEERALQFLNYNKHLDKYVGPLKEPVRVAVTGASGNIGYALLFRIASGQLFGPRTPVHLQLIDLPPMEKALQGVVMELQDCAFPLVHGITATSDLSKGFEGTNWAILVGAKPRSKGMERGDLIKENANIFSTQGKAINKVADPDCHVLVVGNPANTNALIAQRNAPNIPARNFSALTRLDHNRGLSQLADKTGCKVADIRRFAIWGNHSATQYPDITHTQIGDKWAKDILDEKWVKDNFIPRVQKRGAEIIEFRGASSAASAASAVVDHIHDWTFGTQDWTSVAIPSNGEYGVTEGLVYSYPCIMGPKGPEVVGNVPIDPFSAEKMEATHKELLKERDTVAHLIPK